MERLFQIGGALFGIVCNYTVTTTLLRNPEDFAEIIKTRKIPSTFKSKPSAKNMKAYLELFERPCLIFGFQAYWPIFAKDARENPWLREKLLEV